MTTIVRWPVLVLLAACVIFSADQTHAQKVHLLLVGDTADPVIGESVGHDLDNMVLTFFILLRDGQLNHQRVEEDQLSADGILKAIEGLPVESDDALVVFWAGHGAFDEQGHYLQMPVGGNLYRSTLLGAMKKKPARLSVLLSDCCNQYADQSAGKPPVAPASPDPNRDTAPLFDELFFRTRGVVDVNSAAQGELALGTADGGLFTLSLAYMMPGRPDEDVGSLPENSFGVLWRNSQRRLTWQEVVEQARRQVQELFQQMNPDGLIARDGQVYHKQTVVSFSLPERAPPPVDRGSRFGVEAVDNRGEGVRVVRVWAGYPGMKLVDLQTRQTLRLQPGDVILAINGRKITGTKDYWKEVKGSPQTMELTVRDVRDGSVRRLQAKLRY